MLLFLLVFPCLADILASSNLEQCTNAGDETGLDCAEKIVVSLTLNAGQGEVESIQAQIDKIVDENGDEHQLGEPVSIMLSKSAVTYVYPLTYLQHFNNKPYEEVIKVNHGFLSGQQCEDDHNQQDATCGVQHATNGDLIHHSQGFCCSCAFLSNDGIRAGGCDALSVNEQSAHCLRMDEFKYRGYEIGQPTTMFDITARVVWTDNAGVPHDNSVVIGPDSPGASTNDGKIVARLIGSFDAYVDAPIYSDYILFIPDADTLTATTSEYNEKIGQEQDKWMLIRDNFVSFDGRDCNRIGVSYEAFRTQGDACNQLIGTCLAGQLEDYYQEGTHFLPSFGATEYEVTSFTSGAANLHFSTLNYGSTLITLTLDASDISFVINVGSAKIGNCVANNFEALSTNGTLTCIVQNTGNIEAEFTLSVTECTNGVQEMVAKTRSIDVGFNTTIAFTLRSSEIDGNDHECKVRLSNSLEAVIDEKTIQFSTTEVEDTDGAQGGNPGNGGTGIVTPASNDVCDSCSILGIWCYMMNQCWMELGMMVLVVVMVVFCGPFLLKVGIRFVYRMLYSLQTEAPERKRKKKKKNRERYVESETSSESSSDIERRRKKKKRLKKKKSKKK